MQNAPAHNRIALTFYLTTVMAVPFCTPFMKFTGGVENPALFNACIRGGTLVSTIILAAVITGP